jgi:hypothetical protein
MAAPCGPGFKQSCGVSPTGAFNQDMNARKEAAEIIEYIKIHAAECPNTRDDVEIFYINLLQQKLSAVLSNPRDREARQLYAAELNFAINVCNEIQKKIPEIHNHQIAAAVTYMLERFTHNLDDLKREEESAQKGAPPRNVLNRNEEITIEPEGAPHPLKTKAFLDSMNRLLDILITTM